jgi:hypothetical protein
MKLGLLVRKPYREICAFTIAEIVVAVMVLMTVAICFYAGLSSCFGVVQSSREDLRATQILIQKLEAVRLCTWSQLSNFSFQEFYDPLDQTNHEAGALYFGTVSTNVANGISDTSAYKSNVCLVTVTVNWTNYNGHTSMGHTRQMQTQVARYGLQNYIWGAN